MKLRALYSHKRVLEYNKWMKMLLGLLMTFCDTKFPIILLFKAYLNDVYCHPCHIVSQNKIKTMENLAKFLKRTVQT
jgi:hypothetical protein